MRRLRGVHVDAASRIQQPEGDDDTGGVCANSDLALTTAKINSIVGTRLSIGFARELGARTAARA